MRKLKEITRFSIVILMAVILVTGLYLLMEASAAYAYYAMHYTDPVDDAGNRAEVVRNRNEYIRSLLNDNYQVKLYGFCDTSYDIYPNYAISDKEKAGIKAQYKKLNNKTKKIVSDISTDMEKLEAIHRWVTRNIYYDMDFYSGKEKTVYLYAGDAFINKRTTCWGYAAIESYMLQKCGIPAVVAYGKTVDYFNQLWEEVSDFDKAAHSWVMAKIDGIWYNCDPTGDSGNRYENGEFVQNIREWHWFCFPDDVADSNYAIRAINRNELDIRNKTGFFKENGKLYF